MKTDKEYFENAKELVIRKGYCSVSLLKEHFKIGCNTASKIIDELENAGIIDKFLGNRNRKVLIKYNMTMNSFYSGDPAKDYDNYSENSEYYRKQMEKERNRKKYETQYAVAFWATEIDRIERDIAKKTHNIEIYKKCIERVKKWL